jgi:hypothetical protein
MRAKLGKIGLLAALILLSGAVTTLSQAQTDPATASDQTDIVVTGQRQLPPNLETEIRRFVRGHARLSRIDQMTRWRNPICVRVMNLPTGFSNFIVNRIKAVAREAGAPAADEGAECRPNVSIIFTLEPQAVLNRVRSDRPELLGYHFIGEREALATMTRPIQAWYATGTARRYPTPDQFGSVETYVDDSRSEPPSGSPGSRLSSGLRSEFLHVLILVDANQVADAPVGPLADYLAVLSLTEIRNEIWDCGGLVTIMEHFANCPGAPEALTSADRAFLHGLYTMDKWSFGTLQRSQIGNRMSSTQRDQQADSESTGERQVWD